MSEQAEYVRDSIQRLKLEHTAAALEKNRITAEIVDSPETLIRRLREMIPAGATTAAGGSMTLEETGVMDWLKNGETTFLAADSHRADQQETLRLAHFCDYYFMSSNAVTMNGELYNVDGNGNRVSALIHGPEHVIIVAGANKIVKDIPAAEQRVREIAAPCNSVRLQRNTGCSKTGYCVNCRTDARICCHTVISSYQRHPGRIHVFLLPEAYGF